MIDIYSSLYPKFFKFYNNQVFFAVSYDSIIKRSSNKKNKATFMKEARTSKFILCRTDRT